MANLVLGPMLRYVSDTEATVWVETDEPAEVAVLGHRAPTFGIAGHHYCLIAIGGLEPGTSTPYEVAIDGKRAWPPPDYPFPEPTLTTFDPQKDDVDISFGSCRLGHPHDEPYCLTKDLDPEGRGVDALYALALRMLTDADTDWPEVILMLGDQVYADNVSPQTAEFIESRRDSSVPPGREIADFEEYTRLYRESWSPPVMRWLFSTVSSSMIFDDHDMNDDWNISSAWVEEMREQPWWEERVLGGLMSYWVYQHLGNLSPAELSENETFQAVKAADDGTEILRDYAAGADRERRGSRWSFYRDIGRTRLIMIDSRAGRVLEREARAMVDEAEWEWIVERATGDFDHLLIGTSLPYVLGEGMQHLETWNELLCNGAWGGLGVRAGESMRRALDLDHWGAFAYSFERMARLLEEVGSGRRGTPPASIVLLSGDVHHAYLAELGFRVGTNVRAPVYQAVCSPLRNSLNRRERLAIKAGLSPAMGWLTRALMRLSGGADPNVRWRISAGPWFDNQIGSLELRARKATMRLDKALPARPGSEERRLEQVFQRTLA
jgi:PhoD-like phosphatase